MLTDDRCDFSTVDIILPTALRQDGEEKQPVKRPVYGRKKQRKPAVKQDANEGHYFVDRRNIESAAFGELVCHISKDVASFGMVMFCMKAPQQKIFLNRVC